MKNEQEALEFLIWQVAMSNTVNSADLYNAGYRLFLVHSTIQHCCCCAAYNPLIGIQVHECAGPPDAHSQAASPTYRSQAKSLTVFCTKAADREFKKLELLRNYSVCLM
jgi:hypothetical protein